MRARTGVGLATLALAGAFGLAAADGRQGAGKPAEKAVAEQKATALANWKRVFQKDPPDSTETRHLLIYGKVPDRALKEVGPALEKAYEEAHKALDVGKEVTWPGKLTVYLIPEKREFNAAVRGIERRRPEDGERGSFSIKSDTPHVLAGPPGEGTDLSIEGQAAAQIGGALLSAKFGAAAPPDWLAEGFGRATAYHAGAQRDLAAERRRAYAAVVRGKRTAKDVWGTGLKAEEAAVARASLVEYLAYSGRLTRFVPFVAALRPQEERPTPTPEAALAAANISPERLTEFWQKWVRGLP